MGSGSPEPATGATRVPPPSLAAPISQPLPYLRERGGNPGRIDMRASGSALYA